MDQPEGRSRDGLRPRRGPAARNALRLAVALEGDLAERLAQRPEESLVTSPAPDRALADRLADLPVARGQHWPFGAVEFEAARVPRQPDMLEHPATPGFGVVDQGLVPHLQQRLRRKRRSP